jgi:hypothetical protein
MALSRLTRASYGSSSFLHCKTTITRSRSGPLPGSQEPTLFAYI